MENPAIMRVLAAMAETSIERGIYVEKLEYKARRGLRRGEHLVVELTVVYPWSRIAALSPDSYWKIPEELAREGAEGGFRRCGGQSRGVGSHYPANPAGTFVVRRESSAKVFGLPRSS